jgi:hypothetical protein
MITFNIKEYASGKIILARHKPHDPPIEGLPPSSSQAILMESDEVETLLKVLQDYADQRRNKEVQ